jgi:hypothetical protein
MGGFADICFRLPAVHADCIWMIVEDILALLEDKSREIFKAEDRWGFAGFKRICGFSWHFQPSVTIEN